MVTAVALGTAPHPVVVELTGVAFLGSAGLAALLTARQRANDRRIPLRVAASTVAARRPIEATGPDTQLDLHSDPATALRGAPAQDAMSAASGES